MAEASPHLPQELDGYKQQWFHDYLAHNPPNTGNQVRARRQPMGRSSCGCRCTAVLQAAAAPGAADQPGHAWRAGRSLQGSPPPAGSAGRRAQLAGRPPPCLCCAPPQFLAELFKQPCSEVLDASTATVHKIEPANLAHRIIEIRSSMSHAMLKFPK